MTLLRAINPRNLLLIMCLIVSVMIGIKAVQIYNKISAYHEAEQLYAAEKLVEAEDRYQQAFGNRWIHYHEEIISDRLQELAPITEMKQQLAEVRSEADQAVRQVDFDGFMDVYDKLQIIRNTYVGSNHAFEAYYRELSAKYEVSIGIVSGFEQFRQHYDSVMASNLERDHYSDESFKNNLLRIPDLYYGGRDKKTALLQEKFRAYDVRKLSRLGAAGRYSELLTEATTTLALYNQLNMDAPWVGDQVESIVETVLEKDAKQRQVEVYITHAKDYLQFAQQAELGDSLATDIEKQIQAWMKEAAALSEDRQYEQAIQLYTALSGYHDTSAAIDAVNIAWMGDEPQRLLQKAKAGTVFHHAIGGTDRFGVKVFAAAVDEHNRMYFASWNGGDDEVKLISDDLLEQDATIHSITINDKLSTNKRPVLLIESSSETRLAQFTIVQVKDKNFKVQLQIDADRLELVESGKLIAHNPNIAGAEGGTAAYRLLLGEYRLFKVEKAPSHDDRLPLQEGSDAEDSSDQASGTRGPSTPVSEANYIDIMVEDLPQHRHERVRFTCDIVEGGGGVIYGMMGDSYVMLNGNVTADHSTVTVIGTYINTTEVQTGQHTVSIPVFDIDTIEPS